MMPPDEAIAAFRGRVEGRPYRLGCGGPDYWDCWALFAAFQREVMGRTVPGGLASDWSGPLSLARHPARGAWAETARPEPGDGVEFLRDRTPYHVGIWLPDAGGSVLHAVEGVGVVVDSLFLLRAQGQRFRVLAYAGEMAG